MCFVKKVSVGEALVSLKPEDLELSSPLQVSGGIKLEPPRFLGLDLGLLRVKDTIGVMIVISCHL